MSEKIFDLDSLSLDVDRWGTFDDEYGSERVLADGSIEFILPQYIVKEDNTPRTILEYDLWLEDHALKQVYGTATDFCLSSDTQHKLSTEFGEDPKFILLDLITATYETSPNRHEDEKLTKAKEKFPFLEARDEFMTTLTEQPEFKVLKRRSEHSIELCKELSVKFTEHYVKYLKERKEKEEERKSLADKLRSASPMERAELMRLLRKATSEARRSAEMAAKRALSDGKGSADSMDDLMDTLSSLSGGRCTDWRGGKGRITSNEVDVKSLFNSYTKIIGDKKLHKIMMQAGKLIKRYNAAKVEKGNRVADEISEITLGNKIEKLLTSEKTRLITPELQLDAMRRLIDKQSLCLEIKQKSFEARGAIIIVVDESGSMHHLNQNAKAIGLAMVHIARAQKRWCGLVSYSGGQAPKTSLIDPKKPLNYDELLEWLTGFLSGGTDLDIPLAEMPKIYKDLGAIKGKTDVIMITDGCMSISDVPRHQRYLSDYKKWEKTVNCKTLGLGLSRLDQLQLVCEKVFPVRTLDADEMVIEDVVKSFA